ncbi:L-threonylcarbamoyladenylate synthase [Faecalibacillus faecis]|uniref:L-threonylcarbamoyladenylate synthase n=1 Tax=Faecalibacillus faecis TaxID=1982628 RepID=UPI00386EF4B2
METVLVEKENINEVIDLLNHDEVVAFPTETVFGLGVKFSHLEALEKIYEIKHRSHNKAISLMIYDPKDIEKYAYVNENAQKLIDHFMPGMITLVLKKKSILSDDFTAGYDTIGIRIPDDPFVLKLLKEVGPMLVTSANISGQETLLNDQEVYKQFEGKIKMIVKGECKSTLASTVIKVDEDVTILRQGCIQEEEIREVLK